jgi:tetratricopeptide repeat protein 30
MRFFVLSIKVLDNDIFSYIPIVMAQAKVNWDGRQWAAVEKTLRKTMEYCSEHDTWRINVGHVLFMQEKYSDAINFYEPFVQKNYEKVSYFSNCFTLASILRSWTYLLLY